MYKVPSYILLFLLLHPAFVTTAQQHREAPDTVVEEAKKISVETVDTTVFSPIKSTGPVVVRTVPQPRIDSLKAADDFWYANFEPARKEVDFKNENAGAPWFFKQEWFRTILWLFILASFIAIVGWYLVSGNILIFRREAKTIDDGLTGQVTDDIFSTRFDKEISVAEGEENYRQAVRLWYLCTLKALIDKGVINFKPGLTNHDYVAQLSTGKCHRDFSRLTQNFDYTWYGQFKLSRESYQMMRDDFSSFIKVLR